MLQSTENYTKLYGYQKKDAKALHYFFLRTINELFLLLDLPSPKTHLCYFLSTAVYTHNVE